MKTKILLFAAVLLFSFSIVIFTTTTLDAGMGYCYCIEGIYIPDCPSDYSYAGAFLNLSKCHGNSCRGYYTLKCRCNCCGQITETRYTEDVPDCPDC